MPIPEDLQRAWDEAVENTEVKEDPEAALAALRSAWGSIENDAQRAKTLTLAADAGTELGLSDQGNQKSHWQKAYKNYAKSLEIDTKNKETRRKMNKLASMMDEKAISLGLGFQMFDQGNPTPLGLLVMLASVALLLSSIKLVSDLFDDDDNPIVVLDVQYVLNGQPVTGQIEIEMYRADAPMHVESFLTHAENFQYDDKVFHRVINGFMIQGGDIENMAGSGGYAAHYYGWCNGEQVPQSECAQKEHWTIPYEHDNGLMHTPGAVAAAHAGLNTDGSQFYIVPGDAEPCWLDADRDRDSAGNCIDEPNKDCTAAGKSCHTVFGYVISGMEHVDAISDVQTDNRDSPVDEVTVLTARVSN